MGKYKDNETGSVIMLLSSLIKTSMSCLSCEECGVGEASPETREFEKQHLFPSFVIRKSDETQRGS